LTAIVSLVVGEEGCVRSGVLGVGFQCFENPGDVKFQNDAYPEPEHRMQPKPKAYTNRKESRQAKHNRETKARNDLNMGGGADNKRKYKSNKKPKTKQTKKPYEQKRATMKKKWKASSSVSGDATHGRFAKKKR
jgi:hypothetical protein